jgi:hypothetical protein
MDHQEVRKMLGWQRQLALIFDAFERVRWAEVMRELRRLVSGGTRMAEVMQHWVIVEDACGLRLMTRERAAAELEACVVIPSDLYRPQG